MTSNQTFKLRVEKAAAQAILALELEDTSEYDLQCIVYHEMQALALRLSRLVACSEEKAVQIIKYPANAWEHIKQDYFPNFLLIKFPIQYTTVIVYAKETFPELKGITKGMRTFSFRKFEEFSL